MISFRSVIDIPTALIGAPVTVCLLPLVTYESKSAQNGKNISRKARKGRKESPKLLPLLFENKSLACFSWRTLRALRETPLDFPACPG
jgi:hypothetical protein